MNHIFCFEEQSLKFYWKVNILSQSILLAWLGNTDINAAEGNRNVGLGPIAQAVESNKFDTIILVSNHKKETSNNYKKWLESKTKAEVEIHYEFLSSPTHYEEIYRAVDRVIVDALKKYGSTSKLTFHLSPGTPAMTAIWIILAKTRYQAALIESSRELGVRNVKIPFELSAEFIPDLLRESDKKLRQKASSDQPETPVEFDKIIHRSDKMRTILIQAKKVAIRNIPVLIEGESGTGKELLARAIHQASLRNNEKFIAVNCGAIPSELVESEFFGHKKGSFTGAVADKIGYFQQADKGTLFLDEIGELPLSAQVKLLRVLQEGEVTKVGDTKVEKVDVRVISATNRNLLREISKQNFREDLFYRLAVIILKIPALREREGDIGILIDTFWEQLNNESQELGIKPKELSVAAKNILLQHNWTGNVRELQNTLTRLAVTSIKDKVSKTEANDSLLKNVDSNTEEILNRQLNNKFNIDDIIAEVSRHYVEKALNQTNGNKTAAAKLLGFNNYQTLKNWIEKYNI